MKYTYTEERTAIGVSYKYHGDGMPRYANGIHIIQWDGTKTEADRIAGMLNAAWEAGRRAHAAEIRALIGI